MSPEDRASFAAELRPVRCVVENGERATQECIDGPRPCPYVSCKYNLYLDVSPDTGAIKLNFPDREPDAMGVSCALDVADAGGLSLEASGQALNVTRERIRQIDVLIQDVVRRKAPWLREYLP